MRSRRGVVTASCTSTRTLRTVAGSNRSSLRWPTRSEEHTSELQSQSNLVCRLLLEKKKTSHDASTYTRLPWNSPYHLPRRPTLLQSTPQTSDTPDACQTHSAQMHHDHDYDHARPSS